ncbi:unnamed protein product [Citrullus colocynthis]|uniref:Uncharacterized protein n=1 Tax=Citrullus colocynthis TaxID=252529 RepID=A0ABP0XTN8_9ROSI
MLEIEPSISSPNSSRKSLPPTAYFAFDSSIGNRNLVGNLCSDRMENTDNNALSILSREKLDQVAAWVAATMSSAFFSSLERFSCVNIATNDLDDEDDDDQLLLSNQPLSDQIILPDQQDGFVDLPV